MEKSCGVELGWIIMVFNSILYCVSVCLGGKCNNASLHVQLVTRYPTFYVTLLADHWQKRSADWNILLLR